MHCDQFETRVHELLDERRPIDLLAESELLEHARTCPACCDFALGMGMAFEGLRQPLRPGAPGDLAQRVAAELRPPRVLSFTRRRVRVMALAAAAVVLLAVGLTRTVDRGLAPNSRIDNVAATTAASTAASANEYLELARQAQHSLASAWSIWPGAPEATANQPEANAEDVWSQEFGESLSPVTRSTSGALDSLWRLLPSGGEESRS